MPDGTGLPRRYSGISFYDYTQVVLETFLGVSRSGFRMDEVTLWHELFN